jgi:hypothetical protein
LGDVKTSKTIQLQISTVGTIVVVALSVVSTESFASWWWALIGATPEFIQSYVSDTASFIPFLKAAMFLDASTPPFFIVVALYWTALSWIRFIDVVLNLVQYISTFVVDNIFKRLCNCLPRKLQIINSGSAFRVLHTYIIPVLFLGSVFVLSCAASPLMMYQNNSNTQGNQLELKPSLLNLMSPTKLSAAIVLALLFLIVVLCILVVLTPIGTTALETSKNNALRGCVHLMLSILPLHISSVLMSIDVLKTELIFIPWETTMHLIVWRLPCIVALFYGLYTIFKNGSPTKCQSETEANMTEYVVGNETFRYDYRTGPPESVSKGMRLAYWRVARREQLDKIFGDAINIRTMLVNHMQVIRSFNNDVSQKNTSAETKSIAKEDVTTAEKNHTLCLGILDKFQKLQLALDAVSSVPEFDDHAPCGVVRGRRKAMQKEVNKQLSVGDELKKITSKLSLDLGKKLADPELPWPDTSATLPIVPDVVCPPVPSASTTVKEEENVGGSEATGAGHIVYFSSDQFDAITGTMLVVLIFGIGFTNFTWNITAMYNSVYTTSLFFGVLSFLSYKN